MSNEIELMRERVTAIASRARDDGLILDPASVAAQVIRDEAEYLGVRVSLSYRLATAALRFHVDVTVGDPVWPPPQEVLLPGLLKGEISLLGYPLSTSVAEKAVTAVQRGAANTRWRDYADVYILSGTHWFSGDELTEAIRLVADHRGADLEPLAGLLDDFPGLAQTKWAAWRAKQSYSATLPTNFADVLAAVSRFVDTVVVGAAVGLSWDPCLRRWT